MDAAKRGTYELGRLGILTSGAHHTTLLGVAYHHSYYQDQDSVETYIDRFTELLDLAEYDEIDDARHLASKFQKGLNKSIRSQINMAESQPAYDDFEGWVEAARKVVENREANQVFEDTVRTYDQSSIPPKPAPALPKTVSFAPRPTVFTPRPPPPYCCRSSVQKQVWTQTELEPNLWFGSVQAGSAEPFTRFGSQFWDPVIFRNQFKPV